MRKTVILLAVAATGVAAALVTFQCTWRDTEPTTKTDRGNVTHRVEKSNAADLPGTENGKSGADSILAREAQLRKLSNSLRRMMSRTDVLGLLGRPSVDYGRICIYSTHPTKIVPELEDPFSVLYVSFGDFGLRLSRWDTPAKVDQATVKAIRARESELRKLSSSLRKNMSQSEVAELLGRPTAKWPKGDFWRYSTHPKENGGTMADLFLVFGVYFDLDGRLQAWVWELPPIRSTLTSTFVWARETELRELASFLRRDMSRSEVVQLLGPPSWKEGGKLTYSPHSEKTNHIATLSYKILSLSLDKNGRLREWEWSPQRVGDWP